MAMPVGEPEYRSTTMRDSLSNLRMYPLALNSSSGASSFAGAVIFHEFRAGGLRRLRALPYLSQQGISLRAFSDVIVAGYGHWTISLSA